jgi:diguanylate cyclase (GGDEF)-like protein
MNKIITFGKEHLIFVLEILLFFVFLRILLTSDLGHTHKLLSSVLLVLLLVGCSFLFLSEQRKKLDLEEAQKHQNERFQKLSELTLELSRIPFVPEKLPEIAPRLNSLFNEFLQTDRFLLFVKKGRTYQPLISGSVSLPELGKTSLKLGNEFSTLLKSKTGICDLSDQEFMQTLKIPQFLRTLCQEYQYDSLIPLVAESELWGFVLYQTEGKTQSDRKGSWSELGLLPLLLNQLVLNLEKQNLFVKLSEFEKKYSTSANQYSTDLSVLNRDLKRKIFDLNTMVGLVKTLYSGLEEEGLFASLSRMVQENLGAKSTLLMLPQKENGDLVGKHFYGIEVFDLIGKESISELSIQKGTPLFSWIRNEKQIWQLFTMQKLAREEKFLKSLLATGFQVGAKLSFTRDSFGVIFLGEKTDGAKYRQLDLDILSILVNTTVMAYKNIVHYKSIEELSYIDGMTELYNYRYFYKRLTEEVQRAKRFDRKLALVILDIDDFKSYNDNFGHQAGDQLLKQLGRLLSRTVRSIDVVSRYGGEEFCVIMPESNVDECFKFMERLRKSIMSFAFKSEVESTGEEFQKHEHNITVSLGGAIYPQDAPTVDRLIYCADMALLKAKSANKNRSLMYEEQLAAVNG